MRGSFHPFYIRELSRTLKSGPLTLQRRCFHPFYIRELSRTGPVVGGRPETIHPVSIPSTSGNCLGLTIQVLQERVRWGFHPFYIRELSRTTALRVLQPKVLQVFPSLLHQGTVSDSQRLISIPSVPVSIPSTSGNCLGPGDMKTKFANIVSIPSTSGNCLGLPR